MLRETEIDAADVATPPSGTKTLFLDEADGQFKTKDSSGTVETLKGDTGTAGADGADGAPGQGVPAGGTTGQRLAKIDGTDYNTEWVDPTDGLPPGGTVGQILTKQSGADFDADWADAPTGGTGTGSTLSITTNLKAYYKASNATKTGSRITALADDAASGGGVSLGQATANAQPLYLPNRWNGNPVMLFQGPARLFASTLVLPADNWTLFVVCAPQIVDSSHRMVVNNGNATTGYALSMTTGVAESLKQLVAFQTSDAYFSIGSPQIFCLERASGVMTIYKNGKTAANTLSGNATNTTPTGFCIGGDASNGYFVGEIAEVVGYDAALNSTDRGTVFADLGAAYNIPVE